MRRFVLVTIVAAIAGALAGCGKSDAELQRERAAKAAQEQQAQPPPPAATTPPPATTTAAPALPTTEVKIASVANTMTFDQTTFTVQAGQPVHLVFKNNSTMDTLPHNWVLGAASSDPATIAAAGLKLGPEAGYIDARDKNVLAHTPLAKAGQTVDVTFTAPTTPGTYPYFCTCPGHYMLMKGKLVVT